MRTTDQLINRARELATKADPGLIAVDFQTCRWEGFTHAIEIVRRTPTCGSQRTIHALESELHRMMTSPDK